MAGLDAESARKVAREAYTFGWACAEHYNSIFAFSLHKENPQYKGPFNQISSWARVFTPDDTVIVTPNSDTPYSFVVLDLRAEPMVISAPPIEEGRYWSFQVIDMWTHNAAYLGTRTTGNGGGSYLFAGPGWSGAKPDGCSSVIQLETDFAFVVGRTQLFNEADIEKVKAIQDQYVCRPLSSFLGQAAPPPAPAPKWPVALGGPGNKTVSVFEVIDFVLHDLVPDAHPDDKAVRDRLLSAGIGSGNFKVAALDGAVKEAMEQGIADAWADFEQLQQTAIVPGKMTSGDMFGTRDYLSRPGAPCGIYLARFAGAKIGLYGNSTQEAIYPFYKELGGEVLDCSKHSYCLKLSPVDMSMATAFWSLTMYDGKSQFLVHNPLNRYLLNSVMADSMKKEDDGSIVIHISTAPPSEDVKCNWLPAPGGPFFVVMRVYLPKPEAASGEWKAPKMQIVAARAYSQRGGA